MRKRNWTEQYLILKYDLLKYKKSSLLVTEARRRQRREGKNALSQLALLLCLKNYNFSWRLASRVTVAFVIPFGWLKARGSSHKKIKTIWHHFSLPYVCWFYVFCSILSEDNQRCRFKGSARFCLRSIVNLQGKSLLSFIGLYPFPRWLLKIVFIQEESESSKTDF